MFLESVGFGKKICSWILLSKSQIGEEFDTFQRATQASQSQCTWFREVLMSDYCSLHPDWTANDDSVRALPWPMQTNAGFSISGDVLFERGVPKVPTVIRWPLHPNPVFVIRGERLDIVIRCCPSNILHCSMRVHQTSAECKTPSPFWNADAQVVHHCLFAFSPEGAYSFYVQLSNGTIRQHRGEMDAGLRSPEVTISSVLLGWTDARVTGGISNVRVWPAYLQWDDVFGEKNRKRKRSAEIERSMEVMWEARRFCDATVTCEGKAFKVHRAVLAARSTAFAAMFSCDGTREAAQQMVSIENADAATLEIFLKYFYVGMVPPQCNLSVLLRLADQYGVESLAEECADKILEGQLPATDGLLALYPLRDRDNFRMFWKRLLVKASSNQTEACAAIEGLLGHFCEASTG